MKSINRQETANTPRGHCWTRISKHKFAQALNTKFISRRKRKCKGSAKRSEAVLVILGIDKLDIFKEYLFLCVTLQYRN